LFELEKSNVFH